MRRAGRLFASCTITVACFVALGPALPGCGVMTSADCSERANCPDEGGSPVSDATVDTAMEASPPPSDDHDAQPPIEAGADADATAPDAGDAADAFPETGVADVRSTDAPSDSAPDVSPIPDAGNDGRPPADASCIDAGVEDCTNGIDDNCDGKIDCEDPECSAYACVPPVPAQWNGPIALWQGAKSATPPACQASFANPMDESSGLQVSPGSCGCTCTAAGQVCSATGSFFATQACGTSPCATTTAASDGSCTTVTGSGGCGQGGSFSLAGGGALAATGGTCGATVTQSFPTATWSNAARICGYSATEGAGCTASAHCVLKPTGSYGSTLCVFSTQSPPPTACPTGFTSSAPMTFYGTFADGRSCTACACGTPSGGTCTGSIHLYGTSAGGCNGSPVTYTLGGPPCQAYGNGSVASLPASPGFVQSALTVATPGSCGNPTTAPQPTGAVTPGSPVTVCCM